MNAAHELRTSRLWLEPLRAAHAREVFDAYADPELWRFFPALRPPDVESLAIRFRRWLAGPPPGSAADLHENWIAYDDARAVGLFQATLFTDGEGALAYAVFAPFQRRGYAREATRNIVAHLFDVHAVRCVSADVDARNAPSIALLQALGMRVASRRPASANDHEAGEDLHFELLRPD